MRRGPRARAPRSSFRAACWIALLLSLARPVAGEDPDAATGMDAAVRGDWATACQTFAKAKGDMRAGLRLTAARAQANARLAPAIDNLTRQGRWRQLAEAAACGLLVDPSQARYASAARRAAKEGMPEVPPTDARVRPWATYGMDFGEAEALADGCLEFLVKTQGENGLWSCNKHGGGDDHDVGVTALALLALTPHRREAADRAAKAILSAQQPNGCFGDTRGTKSVYEDALAIEALAEHAIRTGQTDAYRDAIERATRFLLEGQNPGAGWRYEPRGGESDTSVTERAACALHAAQRAGVSVDPAGLAGARAYIESMTEVNFGQTGYNLPGGSPSRFDEMVDAFPPEHTHSMTAAGCAVKVLAGSDPLGLEKSLSLMQQVLPSSRYPDMYYWELGAHAWTLAYGQIPADWHSALVKSAATCRAQDGGMRACDAWGKAGGRIYATAMTALALMAPCRIEPKLSARPFFETGKCETEIIGWTVAAPTGIYVDSGETLTVRAGGTIALSEDGDEIGPEGVATRPGGASGPRNGKAPFGCLLGRIDNGTPFSLAIGKKNTMKGTGHLWLLINEDSPSDNWGAWNVTIERPK
jgi:hypothetical protein